MKEKLSIPSDMILIFIYAVLILGIIIYGVTDNIDRIVHRYDNIDAYIIDNECVLTGISIDTQTYQCANGVTVTR